MKYLKMFNESSDTLYSEVSSSIYEMGLRSRIPIPYNLSDKIISMLDTNYNIESYPKFIEIEFNNIYIVINQLEDDWFHIRYVLDGYTTYYKCDQMEGLVQLLKDKNAIK